MIERRPHGSGWERVDIPSSPLDEFGRGGWKYGRITVISSASDMEWPDGKGIGPQWLISISRDGRRPSPGDVRKALRSFGMVGAEEDNHEPGVARKFFLVVDPAHRVTCQCKSDEDVIVEPDGYTWTNPKPETGEECRGCAASARTGRACTIHAGEVTG